MALDKITHISGKGVYIPGDDIDTDQIIPARFMKCLTFDDLGQYLFHDVQRDREGNMRAHPLNDSRFSEASIVISGSNFGCGSSREHAPQAIYRAGFRAVIAESFAEIFYGNATTLGMPCVEASAEDIRELAEAIRQKPDMEITIDLTSERVTFGDKAMSVTVKPVAREALTGGYWDPIAELLEADQQIDATKARLAYV